MRRLALALVALPVLAAGCTSAPAREVSGRAIAAAPTTTTAPPTTTTLPPTTTTVPPPPPPPPAPAPAITNVALEQRLADLRFDVRKIDDVFDSETHHAVMAFQKVHGLPRTGKPTPDVVDKLASAGLPPPMVPGGGPVRVEIQLSRQVLFLFQNDQLAKVAHVATGNGKRFCDGGRCRRAITPKGSFQVFRRLNGWHRSELGRLYSPLFFVGGVAIHGATSVPAAPASHGCVRIPMVTAAWFPSMVPNGTPVYVVA